MIIATANPEAADQTRSLSASKMNQNPKPDPLTKRQRQIYDHLRERIESDGYAPSVREMCDHFDIKSPNGIICHLVALQKKGLIVRTSHRSRAIRLVETNGSTNCNMTLFGTSKPGMPLELAASSEEQINYGPLFRGNNLVIAVCGDQFRDLGICSGDELIVSPTRVATSDFMIAALDLSQQLILCRHTSLGLTSVLDMNDKPQTSRVLGTVISVVRRFNS